MRKDVIVLGAGIVGVSVAVHLQQRGRSVLLVDRRGPGEETSYGNAGLIQREGVYPYGFPHDFGALLRYATNRTIDAHYHLAALPKLAPFLFRYWMHSRPEEHRAIARLYAPLIEHSVTEHAALAEAAGATDLIRPTGWMKVFRSQKVMDAQLLDVEATKRDFGVNFEAFDGKGVAEREPHLKAQFHRRHPLDRPGCDLRSVSADDGLRAPVREARRRTAPKGDARTLEAEARRLERQDRKPARSRPATWSWRSAPWADLVTQGSRISPAARGQARLPYALQAATATRCSTARRSISSAAISWRPCRKASALRRAPSSPTAMRRRRRCNSQRAEPIAKTFFPLGERVDPEPWMGMRPCTPDMMPIIGKAHRHKNLWFSFGHAHHGMTLGPITGRLVAEMITGEKPVIDPTPYGVGEVLG